jgi:hypothetical protein
MFIRHRRERGFAVPQGHLKPRIGEGRTASQRIVFAMDEQTHVKGFAWQEGYGAFTVGVSQKPRTVDYMKRQAENHRNLSFEEEFLAFLKKRAIDYNPKYVRG